MVTTLWRCAVIISMAAWAGFYFHSLYLDWHACNGHPCGLWQDVVRKSPEKPRGYMNLGEAYRKHGKLDLALEAYQKAEIVSAADSRPAGEQETTDLLATTNIAAIIAIQGQADNAYQILAQGWKRYPDFPGFAVGLGSFYIQRGRPQEAVDVLNTGIDQGLKEYPWFNGVAPGMLYLNRGFAFQMLGRCDLAQADYTHARKFPYPENIPAVIPCP